MITASVVLPVCVGFACSPCIGMFHIHVMLNSADAPNQCGVHKVAMTHMYY